MSPETIAQFASQGFNRVPIVRRVLADLDTPLSTYLKLANAPYSYLLESVHGGEKWGRYSIIGLPCQTGLSVRDHQVTVFNNHQIVEQHESVADPLAFVEQFSQRFRVPEIAGLPRFNGGLVGYFGYDTVRYIEKRLHKPLKPDPIGTPDILLLVSDELVVFDNLSGSIYVIVHIDPAVDGALLQANARIDAITQQMRQPLDMNKQEITDQAVPTITTESDFTSEFSREGYCAAVSKIKEYILAGDVMQVVPSQRMRVDFDAAPIDLYRALRLLNPSPYMYFFNFDNFHVVGSSPEILTRVEARKVTVRPIAGTRRRGQSEAEDLALEKELLADPKEVAEHVMLIDLGRNDVGRVSQAGTVELTSNMAIERYSHVMHIVSNVEGELDPGLSTMDVLRATFPAGTLSGAPKIRAMEIIDELEPVKRGIYSGAVGYLTWHGDMDTAIAIRTAVIKDGVLTVQAGAGVVADSVPESEWQETLSKGRAIFKAVELVNKGLVPDQMP